MSYGWVNPAAGPGAGVPSLLMAHLSACAHSRRMYGIAIHCPLLGTAAVPIRGQQSRCGTNRSGPAPACATHSASGVGAAVARGPVVSRMIQQLLADTAWGECDFLVLDMPPGGFLNALAYPMHTRLVRSAVLFPVVTNERTGTGDIQLTLCQTLKISSAVMVTTPHKLAYIDVVRECPARCCECLSYGSLLHGVVARTHAASASMSARRRLSIAEATALARGDRNV
jgi:hypothetical protein